MAFDGIKNIMLKDLHLALVFMTRLPWPSLSKDQSLDQLARAMRLFPLVGLIIGLLGSAVFALTYQVLPSFLAATLAVVATIIATGALHEDGLADVADGFGGGTTRERKLEIMKDSRVGSFGVIAMALDLALRVGALAVLAGPMRAVIGLLVSHALGRTAIPFALYLLPPARTNGLGAGVGRPDLRISLTALLISLLILTLLLPLGVVLAVLAVSFLAGSAVIGLARRHIGGQTGDVLGAIEQVTEIAVLLALVASW